MDVRATVSGDFVIYRGSEAGAPHLHDPNQWYYEPHGWGQGEVYSDGYPTAEAALAAAEAWEMQSCAEDEYIQMIGELSPSAEE